MGKYIIDIPDDKVADFVGGTHLLMPYLMAGHKGHHDTGLPLTPYIEPDLEAIRKEAYDEGYKKCLSEHDFDSPCTSCETVKEVYQKGYETGKKEVETKYCSYDACKNRQEEYQRGYKQGLEAVDLAWEAARKIAEMWFIKNHKDVYAAFGIETDWDASDLDIKVLFNKLTASEAIERLKEYEQIKSGDEIEYSNGIKALVLDVNDKRLSILNDRGYTDLSHWKGNVKKTGRCYPETVDLIKNLRKWGLEAIKGEGSW